MRLIMGSILIVLGPDGAASVLAGMPSITLTDITRLRLQTLSFFVLAVLATAAVVCWLWNGLRRDVPQLPAIGYRSALGGTVLWGLLFLFVLTMISGARELLTPGAWEKHGLTYQLAGSSGSPDKASESGDAGISLETRRKSLETLGAALILYAARHDGRFPDQRDDLPGDRATWDHPGFPLTPYELIRGRTVHEAPTLVAFELELYPDGTRFGLWTDGRVEPLTASVLTALTAELATSAPPAELQK